jgi:hypothetical protein
MGGFNVLRPASLGRGTYVLNRETLMSLLVIVGVVKRPSIYHEYNAEHPCDFVNLSLSVVPLPQSSPAVEALWWTCRGCVGHMLIKLHNAQRVFRRLNIYKLRRQSLSELIPHVSGISHADTLNVCSRHSATWRSQKPKEVPQQF